MSSALFVVGGAAVLTLAVVDIFITVLHHWGGAGPLSARLARGVWCLARPAVRPLSPRHARMALSVVGPLLIPLTLLLWAALVVVGFGLIYLAALPEGFAATDQTPVPTTLAGAVYVSGVIFFTLGFGDVVPTSTALRLLTVAEAGSGFALITLGISYFTTVYQAFSRQKALAETVDGLSGGNGAAGFVARRQPDVLGATALQGELARYRDALAEIRAAYSDYPIIHYFVAPQPRDSLLRVVFVARDLSLLLYTAVDTDRCPALAGLGRRAGLEPVAQAVTDSLARALFGGSEKEARQKLEAHPLGDEDRTRLRDRFREARELLRDAGIPVREDPDAEEEYVASRQVWERVLQRCAVRVGEDWQDIHGGR